MTTACQMVYRAAGSPEVPGCGPVAGPCHLCGGAATRGRRVVDWMGSGFTDQARVAVPSSDVVCEACCFVTSRVSPVPGRPPGACAVCRGTLSVVVVPPAGKGSRSRKGDPCPKCDGTGMNAAGGNFRSYSHGADAAGYWNASKGEKPVIRAFLARRKVGPWFCAVADSGQKHVVPFAPVNDGDGVAGTVQFEEARVWWPWWAPALVERLSQVLTDGATKDEIEAGDYRPWTWRTLGRDRVRAIESEVAPLRGGGLLALCLWSAQRDEEAVEARRAAAAETVEVSGAGRRGVGRRGARGDGGGAGRGPVGPHGDDRGEPAEAVRDRPEPGPVGGADERERPGVGDGAPARSEDPDGEQFDLFGGGGAP